MQEEEAHNLEQVAEAALLSIGAVLEWDQWDFDGKKAFFVRSELAAYACALSTEGNLFVALSYCVGEGMVSRNYTTMAEAKAACEVHAATGQFPPGVEPELLNAEHQLSGASGAAWG